MYLKDNGKSCGESSGALEYFSGTFEKYLVGHCPVRECLS